nr:MAG: hypothetical protein [Bacteriophage sp.]
MAEFTATLKKVNTMEKQNMYKTAYSSEFCCYVGINRAWKDSNGKWIFECSNVTKGLDNFLFRESELEKFCL